MGVKGILGIRNRTENWKTARFFTPLFSNGGVHLAQKILKQPENEIPDARLELYWKGMRDHVYETKEDRNPKKLAHCYDSQFQSLRDRIEDYGKFRELKSGNYISKGNEESLCNNLINTEIDIVIETPDHLFIGEAKHESNFGANSELVLVHQLVRQYVMAKILVGLRKCEKEVIPFIVGGSKNNHQIQFMICQGWMVEDNILCWEEIKALWP